MKAIIRFTGTIAALASMSVAEALPIADAYLSPSTGYEITALWDWTDDTTYYDADTWILTQTHSAESGLGDFHYAKDSAGRFANHVWAPASISMTALVDNSGNTLGGAFAWVGAIPDLGITESTLLADGLVSEVRWSVFQHSPYLQVQVEIVNYADALSDLGLGTTLVTSTLSDAWDNNEDLAWSYSTGFETTSIRSMGFYRKTTIPEPGTLALFSVGLLGIILARRRKRA